MYRNPQIYGHALRCGVIVKKIGPLHWRTLSTLLSNLDRISLCSRVKISQQRFQAKRRGIYSDCSWLIKPWSTLVIMLLGDQPMIPMVLWGKWWQDMWGVPGFSHGFPVAHKSSVALAGHFFKIFGKSQLLEWCAVKIIGPQSWMTSYFLNRLPSGNSAMENGPLISDFPMKNSIQFGDFPALPCLMTPETKKCLGPLVPMVFVNGHPKKTACHSAHQALGWGHGWSWNLGAKNGA